MVEGPSTHSKLSVRCIQAELPLCRQQVKELEFRVKRMRLRMEFAPGNKKRENNSQQKGIHSVWNDIAEHQLKERMRAEHEQIELKKLYDEVFEFPTELREIWQKCQVYGEMLVEWVSRESPHKFWDLITSNDEELFSEQLTLVARAYLELKQRCQIPSRSIHFGWDLSLGQEVVKQDSSIQTGIVFEAQCGTMLPFDLDVVVRAYWRFLTNGDGHGGELCSRNMSDALADLISRSFSLSMDFNGQMSRASGKCTYRKYVEKDETTLVWVERANVSELCGVKFTGMQYLKRGSIKLRRIAHDRSKLKSSCTMVEVGSTSTPLFHDAVLDQDIQTRRLIDVIKKSYSRVDRVFCRTMSNLLLEEDWKATFSGKL